MVNEGNVHIITLLIEFVEKVLSNDFDESCKHVVERCHIASMIDEPSTESARRWTNSIKREAGQQVAVDWDASLEIIISLIKTVEMILKK